MKNASGENRQRVPGHEPGNRRLVSKIRHVYVSGDVHVKTDLWASSEPRCFFAIKQGFTVRKFCLTDFLAF